jgi:putative CocE/NonD family hydrolase
MAVRVRSEFPRVAVVREGIFIPLADGTRLAARIWLPQDADTDPVPAVLEYLPYRLNDGTSSGDHQQMRYFAGCGYAGVRVDIRGSGESGGLLSDEYTPQEQADCLEVIAWLAEQPWCTGAVGMMGYSWSGFNALQVAALRPPALEAIMSGYASDDRYADDVHYRGGLVAPMEMVHWSTCMHGWQARPPDPEIVGEGWRAIWLERLEQAPWIEHWLAHQRRDAYWQQGSVRDDYARIACPVLCVAGWTDGYSDAALRLMEGLDVPRRALIGPWGHNDPVHGVPGPAVGILDELVRWWDRWLKGLDSGIEDDPMVVAYVQDPVQPVANLAERPGRFVGEQTWPSARIEPRTLGLGDGTLGVPAASGTRSIGSEQTLGLEGGAWCADGRSADLPLDQRGEDSRSLTYDSEPLDEPLELLGFGEARLMLASDRPLALVSVRLCEVLESGASLLVTRGQLNLCHRRSHAEPELLVPGEEVAVTVRLDAIGHRFAAGSRLRLSVSPCYWPLAWPSPEPVTLTLRHGSGAELVLPERSAAADEPELRPLDEPQEPELLPYEVLAASTGGCRRIERDLGSGATQLIFDWDCGGRMRLPNGIEYEDTSVATYSISEDDPLSANVRVSNTSFYGRGELQVSIAAIGTMTCTASTFLVTSELDVYDGASRVFSRTWTHEFPRDHC